MFLGSQSRTKVSKSISEENRNGKANERYLDNKIDNGRRISADSVLKPCEEVDEGKDAVEEKELVSLVRIDVELQHLNKEK